MEMTSFLVVIRRDGFGCRRKKRIGNLRENIEDWRWIEGVLVIRKNKEVCSFGDINKEIMRLFCRLRR